MSTLFSRKLNTTLAMQLFQLMRLGSVVLTGIVLAKTGLSASTIGAWEMLLYMSTTLTFFWVSGLLQGIAPMYSSLEEDKRKVFIFNNFLLFFAIASTLFLLLFWGEKWIVPLLTSVPELPHFRLFALYLLFNLPSFPVEYYYLLHQKPRQILNWGIFSFGLHLLALFVPMKLGYGLEGGITALTVLALLKFLWTFRLSLQFGRWGFDRQLLWSYLIFCAPLMLSNVASNLMLFIDNYLVNRHFGDPAMFAVYRYGAREFPLATALVSALGASMIPGLREDLAEGMRELKHKSRRLMHLLFPLTVVLMCCSKTLFPLVFNPDFARSADLFNIYLLTLASRILLPSAVLLSKGDSKSLFWVSIAELLVKLVLGVLFIHFWGLPGLAYSVVLSYWVEKIGLIWILESRYRVRTSEWVDWKWYFFYCLFLGSGYLISLQI